MTQEVPQGAKISAYIFFAYAALTLCGGIILGIFTFIMPMAEAYSSEERMMMTVMFAGLTCLLLVIPVLYAVAGYGLLQLKSWGRILAIVLALLNICNVPVGTILGGIVLYYMFGDEETKQAFS